MKKYSVVGIDVSDKNMKAVALDSAGEVAWRDTVTCRKAAMQTAFGQIEPCLMVLETGSQTGWLGQVLIALGHEVVVANARKVQAIWANERKSDWRDAETLARLGRSDRKLLHPVVLRSALVQADLSVLRARDAVVRARVMLVNTTRALVKGVGERVPSCSTQAFARRCRETVSEGGRTAIESLLTAIEAMTTTIRDYDQQIEATAKERYSAAVTPMIAVPGVGTHTALAYALTIENPKRFQNRRQVGAFLGMTPRRDQSGEIDKQLGITHAGDAMLRRLLVGSAHYIIGPFGPDCDLRCFGKHLMSRGGKSAKKRAVVAVARKLSVLLLRLWQTGETYEPFHRQVTHTQAA